jgi:hypothetical protein
VQVIFGTVDRSPAQIRLAQRALDRLVVVPTASAMDAVDASNTA